MQLNIDWANVDLMIEQGYITVRKHPSLDLYIYNYSGMCQIDRVWNYETLNCRGLVTDGQRNVIGRAFPKIFNFEEFNQHLPSGGYDVYEKMDGSLGILFYYKPLNKWLMSTRGSFESEQAIEGQKILEDKYSYLVGTLDKDYTYLFEIIYPGNQIVINYEDRRELVFLSAIHTKEGWEVLPSEDIGFPTPDYLGSFPSLESPLNLKLLEQPNKEGFVLRFSNGLRLKIKFDEYIRLHRVVTKLTNRAIWEAYRFSGSNDWYEFLSTFPDEWFSACLGVVEDLKEQYEEIESEARRVVAEIDPELTDKEKAAIITGKCSNPSIAFLMSKNKPYRDTIFKMIRPDDIVPLRRGKVYITIGLPASGKTTWAKQMVRENPETFVNVNKDDLREMLFSYRFTRENERMVERTRDYLLRENLKLGKSVIVSDTNLNFAQRRRIREIAAELNVPVEEKFFHITVEEAIKRDAARATKPGERSVGAEVIKTMANKWLDKDGNLKNV